MHSFCKTLNKSEEVMNRCFSKTISSVIFLAVYMNILLYVFLIERTNEPWGWANVDLLYCIDSSGLCDQDSFVIPKTNKNI